MLYGSMLGLLGVAVAGTLAARYMGFSSLQDLRPSPAPDGGALQKWLQPYKERIQARIRCCAYQRAESARLLAPCWYH